MPAPFSISSLKSKVGFALTVIFLMTGSSARAQTVGTTTADILKINQGARPAAMGGSYTAMGDDAYSVDYNPAGLSWIKATQLVVLQLNSLANIEYEYLTFATAWGSGNVVAVNATYRNSPPIDNGNGTPPANSDDLLASFSYAGKFSDNFRAGATVKYLNSTLASYNATAVAFDLGVQIDRLPYGFRAGASIQNLGTGMTFDPNSSADSLPMFIRLGLGTHQVIDKTKDLNLSVEIFKPSDQNFKMGIGGECWVFPELFVIRAGYKFEDLGPVTGNVFDNYTIGCTLTRRIEGDDFSLDLAYDPANFTDTTEDTFYIALNFKFNQLRIF
jgi:hypothetical protein